VSPIGLRSRCGLLGRTSLETFNPRSLSVVVPTYNEEANAIPLVRGLVAVLRSMPLPFELIVVDDGSRDATVAQLRSLLPTTPELVIVRLRRNFGQTPALQAGFDRSRGDVIVTLDGDLQNDPRDIPRLLERIQRGADVVSGWRVNRKDGLWLRRLPSQLANRLIRRLTGVPIHDQGCSLKAYRREVVQRLRLYSDMHRFIGVLVMPTGAAIDEIAVLHHPRVAGVSKYGLSRIYKVIADLLTIQMLTRFRESPMRWFALVGAPFLIAAVATGLVAIWEWGESLVLATASLTLAFTCVSCLLAGLFAEAIVGDSGHVSNRNILFREWGSPR
jgi:glycosyltransferase involved in cell wall biosynthesis